MVEISQHPFQPQVRQSGSVPFIWEEKPGTPKKEWKSDLVPLTSFPSPAKLVVSIPFNWEEEPGKPMISVSHPLPNSPFLPLPPSHLVGFPSPSAYSTISSPSTTTIRGKLRSIFRKTNPFVSSDEEDGDDEDDSDEEMLELDFKAFEFNTDESYRSSAVPVQSNESLDLQEKSYNQHEKWAISVSESRGGSTTRYTSVGTSVMEFFFPLFPPDSSFLNHVGYHEKDCAVVALPELLPGKENVYSKGNRSLLVKRSHTLLELIQMSRRLSCRRKAVQVKKQSFSMEFMRMFACCICGAEPQLRHIKKLQ